MAKPRNRPPGRPPSWTDADLAAAKQRMLEWQRNRVAPLSLDEQLERDGKRPEPLAASVTDEQLRTFATAEPTVRQRVDARHDAAAAPANLAEAQVGLVARCTLCGKPVTGREVPRDRAGRPRHHRCPL
jgi:hypothetical protein